VKCAYCGYTLLSSKVSPKRGSEHYLQCQTRFISKDACVGAFISVKRLEKMVLNELNIILSQHLDQNELERNINFTSNLNVQAENTKKNILKYRKKIDEYTNGVRTLYLDKVKGIITDNDYVSMSEDFTTERNRILQFNSLSDSIFI